MEDTWPSRSLGVRMEKDTRKSESHERQGALNRVPSRHPPWDLQLTHTHPGNQQDINPRFHNTIPRVEGSESSSGLTSPLQDSKCQTLLSI